MKRVVELNNEKTVVLSNVRPSKLYLAVQISHTAERGDDGEPNVIDHRNVEILRKIGIGISTSGWLWLSLTHESVNNDDCSLDFIHNSIGNTYEHLHEAIQMKMNYIDTTIYEFDSFKDVPNDFFDDAVIPTIKE